MLIVVVLQARLAGFRVQFLTGTDKRGGGNICSRQ